MAYMPSKARISAAALSVCLFASGCSYATTTLVLAALAGAAQGYANSQAAEPLQASEATGTAFLKDKIETNLTKQCVYDYIGSRHIRTVQKYEVCPQTIAVPLGASLNSPAASQNQKGYAITALFKREVDTGGMTKQCIYEFAGSAYTLTVQKFELCPLNAQFVR